MELPYIYIFICMSLLRWSWTNCATYLFLAWFNSFGEWLRLIYIYIYMLHHAFLSILFAVYIYMCVCINYQVAWGEYESTRSIIYKAYVVELWWNRVVDTDIGFGVINFIYICMYICREVLLARMNICQ